MEQIQDNRLKQATFLHTLGQDFNRFRQMRIKAWPILAKHNVIPTTMTEKEWIRVVGALGDYYQSVQFIYKIALLTESGIIDVDLLYIFYHQEIRELPWMISGLIKWCGTGLDAAANYGPNDLSLISGTLVNLLDILTAVHKQHAADISFDEEVIQKFKESHKDFVTNPKKYADNIVTIRKDRKTGSKSIASQSASQEMKGLT